MNGITIKSKVLLFVYGTLMTGHINHHYLSDAKFLMKCELEDFGMFELGGYPGIKLLDDRCVKGELYAVKKKH